MALALSGPVTHLVEASVHFIEEKWSWFCSVVRSLKSWPLAPQKATFSVGKIKELKMQSA